MGRLGSRLVAAVVVAGAASAVGAGLGAGLGAALTTQGAGALLFSTTSTSTTSPPTTVAALVTTTTVAHSRAPLAATLDPCQAPSAGSPCVVEPTRIEITGTAPAAIQVAWLSEKGRPATAPSPTQSSAMVTKSAACGKGVTCWAWPAQLTAADSAGSWILNGSYQVTACALAANTCTPLSSSTPADLAIAAPAAAPASVKSSYSAASGVTVTWKPGASEPPDTVGYEISREGQTLYACRTVTSTTPVPASACNTPFAFHDDPASGTWTYSVSTLRYGADASTAAVVPSLAQSSLVHVTVQAPSNTVPPYVPLGLPTVPYTPNGSIQAVPPVYTVAPATTAAPTHRTTTTVETGGALPYSSPAQGTTDVAAAAEVGPKNTNLHAWAAVALGLLALALALHVWFLRGQLGTYTAQHRKADHP